MKCKICGSKNQVSFSAKILRKHDINYYHCANCDFLQTEEPYWLDEAYSRSINITDTGYMVRNLFYAKRLTILLYLMFGKNGRFLDFAGGYGVFVRLMRDIGFDFYWIDKYTKNLFSAGFEWDQKSKVDAVTLFEVFEHFVDPIKEVEALLTTADTIFFSTELRPSPVPKPGDWWYYGLDHGQHIAFYSKSTLEFIAGKFGVNYYSIGSLHILSRKEISDFHLLLTRFSRFGLSAFLSRFLESRTWSDYEIVSNASLK